MIAASEFDAGAHVLPWDGRDDSGGRVSAGVYLLRLDAAGAVQTRRLARLD